VDGSNKILNFKASESQGKTPNSEIIQFPNFPLKPTFAFAPTVSKVIQPPYYHSLLGSPPKSRVQVKRKLDFDGMTGSEGEASPRQGKPEGSQSPPFQRTSLSLALLFGQPVPEGFSQPEPMEVEEEKTDFFSGTGASAWTKFKLDTTGMLMPWARRPPSEDED